MQIQKKKNKVEKQKGMLLMKKERSQSTNQMIIIRTEKCKEQQKETRIKRQLLWGGESNTKEKGLSLDLTYSKTTLVSKIRLYYIGMIAYKTKQWTKGIGQRYRTLAIWFEIESE